MQDVSPRGFEVSALGVYGFGVGSRLAPSDPLAIAGLEGLELQRSGFRVWDPSAVDVLLASARFWRSKVPDSPKIPGF